MSSAVSVHTVTYKRLKDDLPFLLDIHTNKQPPPSSLPPQPLVLIWHPGCLVVGDRTSNVPSWLVDALVVQRHWTFLFPDYRLLPESSLADIVDDVSSA